MKFMNKKRVGTAIMAGALALSLAAPAFAADNETVITSEFKAITLNVTVPATGGASINPYGLPVNLTHEEGSGADKKTVIDGTISGEQITVGAPLMIYNGSTVALAVSAEVTGEADTNGAVVLIEDATKVDAEETTGDNTGKVLKNVAAKFEAFPAPTFEGVANDWEVADKNVAFAALKSEDAVLTAPVLAADADGNGKMTTGTLVLREGDEDGNPQAGSAAFIRLSGSVAKKPSEAWAAADKFTATIAFTFEPSEYTGTVTVAGAESVAAGATAKLTVSGLPDGVKVKYDTIKWTSSKETYVTVANGTKAPASGTTTVDATALTGTVTGVKTSSTKSVITVEFVGSDDITYRGSMEVKCG